jgi:hypothetical protein
LQKAIDRLNVTATVRLSVLISDTFSNNIFYGVALTGRKIFVYAGNMCVEQAVREIVAGLECCIG